ncbi:hypothetical protein, partial [Mycoplasmopsis bovis]|uniref:hypothetical protein n=1 Tax=Mycoplasmopsis bovis TaxID=28903 RepID=UPI003D295EC7
SKEELKGILEEFAHNMIVQNVDAKQFSEAINKLSSSNGLGKINAYEIVQLIKSVLGSQSVKKSIGELFLMFSVNDCFIALYWSENSNCLVKDIAS